MTGDVSFQREAAAKRQAAIRAAIERAIAEVGAGDLDEAARTLEADGGAALRTAVGQNIRGDIYLKQARYREALKSFDAAIRLSPSAPEGHCNRGVALQELGRLEEALTAEDRALQRRPNYATAHFNRGNVLKALARNDEAVAAYDRAVQAQPAHAEAFLNRGMTLLTLKKPLDALADFGRALKLRPRLISAYLGRASARRDLGEPEQAFAEIDAALALEPGNREAMRMRASMLLEAERHEESLVAADSLVARDSADEAAHSARAQALRKLQHFTDALEAAEEAVRLAPKSIDALVTRATLLAEVGKVEESLAVLERARELGAANAAFFQARALALQMLQPEAARADFGQALALAPADVQLHSNYGFFLLAVGDWKNGWVEHEWRLKTRASVHNTFAAYAPPWLGEPLAGKRLLVYTEQGHGDTFQFARYLSLIEPTAARVTLVVTTASRALLAASFPGIDVTETIGMRSGFDYQASLMSMPAVFRTTPETVPAQVPYLSVDPARVARWRERIGAGGFRVGIVWQGNRKYPADHQRSIALAEYAPLAAVPGVRLISLQSMIGLEQLDSLPEGMKVERLGEEIENNPDGFREVAAVMMNLDLLIMSDTGPTHLAGALGRPVWLATSRYPDWRWMREREDSPWYPTMRLFRQPALGDWASVFARMARELAALVAARGQG